MRKFQRKIEDFICENCQHEVGGDGYTNHCPECLWSKHVDINPGDRACHCQGLLEPVDAFLKEGNWILIQKCQKCEEEKKIKIKKGDNMGVLEELIQRKIREI